MVPPKDRERKREKHGEGKEAHGGGVALSSSTLFLFLDCDSVSLFLFASPSFSFLVAFSTNYWTYVVVTFVTVFEWISLPFCYIFFFWISEHCFYSENLSTLYFSLNFFNFFPHLFSNLSNFDDPLNLFNQGNTIEKDEPTERGILNTLDCDFLD